MAKPALRRVSRRSAKLGFLRCCRRKNIYPNLVGRRGAESAPA
jgi:ribosomal protein S21